MRHQLLHSDNRPFGTQPNLDNLQYWHQRCKELGAVWSTLRTEFMLSAVEFQHSVRKI